MVKILIAIVVYILTIIESRRCTEFDVILAKGRSQVKIIKVHKSQFKHDWTEKGLATLSIHTRYWTAKIDPAGTPCI